MKLFILIFPLIFSSCSSIFLQKKLEKDNHDLFGKESLLRYSSNRLKLIATKHPLKIKGITYCHNGNIKKGLSFLKKQFLTKKNDPLYWNHVGTCFLLNKKYEKAEYYFQLSLSNNEMSRKKNYLAANNLGILYSTLGHYQDAIDQYKLVFKHHPKLKTPLFNMAQVYIKFAKLNEAKVILTKLLKQNSRDPDINSSLAIIYSLENNHLLAARFFRKLPKSFLRRQELSNFYAYTLYKLNKTQEAILILKAQKKGQSYQMNQFKTKLEILLRERKVL